MTGAARQWRQRIEDRADDLNTVVVAVRIADTFRMRVPQARELMARYGMSQATAYRWVQAIRKARRQAAGME